MKHKVSDEIYEQLPSSACLGFANAYHLLHLAVKNQLAVVLGGEYDEHFVNPNSVKAMQSLRGYCKEIDNAFDAYAESRKS